MVVLKNLDEWKIIIQKKSFDWMFNVNDNYGDEFLFQFKFALL